MGSPLSDVKWRCIDKTPISMPFRSKAAFSSKPSQQRRSLIPNERLFQIFSSKPDEPLHPRKARTSILENYLVEGADENTQPEFYNIITDKSEVTRKFLDNSPLPQNIAIGKLNIEWNTGMSPKTPPANTLKNPVVSRIQEDLDSPSAATRLRAIKVLKSPNKNVNSHFNVPFEGQDLITNEERTLLDQIPSIQEVMRHVVVYVEVRTGVDNRSAGIRKVISSLGAKVNDKFLRDTTHVVFKDGLQSTYNKAKKWNIPVVSILWIEECKKHKKLMDPVLFPIINLDRYENPELFSKLKRQKSLQPDAEENMNTRRKKLKIKETESEKTVKLSSEIRVPRKPKDKLEQILSEFQEKLMNTPGNKDDPLQFESKILQRIRNSPYTPKSHESSGTQIYNSRSATLTVPKSRSELLINNNNNDYDNSKLKDGAFNKTPTVSSTRSSTRKSMTSIKKPKGRSSLQCTDDCDTNKYMSSQKKNVSNIIKDQARMTSIIEGNEEMLESAIKKGKRRRTEFKEHSPVMKEKTSIASNKSSRRKTMFVTQPVEVDNIKESETSTSDKIIFCRRALFNPINVTEEISKGNSSELNNINSNCDTVETSTVKDAFVKTPTQFNSLFEEHVSTAVFNSTRKPSRRRTLFDISMDIIDQRLQNINKSAKQTKPPNDAGLTGNITPISVPRKSQLNDITETINTEVEVNSEGDNNDNNNQEDILDNLPKKRKLFVPVEMTMSPSSIQNFSTKKSDSKRRIRENDESNSNNNRRRKTLFNVNISGMKKNQNSGDNDAISKANNSSAINKRRTSMSALVNTYANGLESEAVNEVQSTDQSAEGSCVKI